MYFILRSAYYVVVGNDVESRSFCENCKSHLNFPSYKNIYLMADKFTHYLQKPSSKGLGYWPISLGSSTSLIFHENLISELDKYNVMGVKFHKIESIHGKVLETLGSPPAYYKVEPLGSLGFLPSPDEFRIADCLCEKRLDPIGFGEFKSPFKVKVTSQGEVDFFDVQYFKFWICVNKAVIDIVVKNRWTEFFKIGNSALPGIQIKEFGENWYEDTMDQLRTSFPNSVILE